MDPLTGAVVLVLGLTIIGGLTRVGMAFFGPSREEARRMTALSMAIDSHGPEAGQQSDRCYTGRARHFEAYLQRGHIHG